MFGPPLAISDPVWLGIIGALSPVAIISAIALYKQATRRIEKRVESVQRTIGSPDEPDDLEIDHTIMELLEGMAKDVGLMRSDLVKARGEAAIAASRTKRIDGKLTQHMGETVPNGHGKKKR